MVQRKLELEYKPRIDNENKTNLQQHKDLESGWRKPNKILGDSFKLRKRKSEEETNRNIRSLSERINITNDPLLPILTSSEAETTTGTNDATEEPVEVGFLENFKVTQKGHDVFQNLKKKKKKQKNSYTPKKKSYQQKQIKTKAKSRGKFTK